MAIEHKSQFTLNIFWRHWSVLQSSVSVYDFYNVNNSRYDWHPNL